MVLGGFALGIIAVFLPPLPVLWRAGCGAAFLINIVLLFLGWLPAVLHAWYIILEYPNLRQKHAENRSFRERRRSESVASRRSDARSRRGGESPPDYTEYIYEGRTVVPRSGSSDSDDSHRSGRARVPRRKY